LTGQSTAQSITPPYTAADGAEPAAAQRWALVRGRRALKRWRYVGIFCEELMACAARVQIGPARQCFWALFLRADGRLRERTHMLGRLAAVQLAPGHVRVRDGAVVLDVQLDESDGIQARCLHDGGEVWTRKQAGVAARCTLALDGAPARSIEARAVIDDTAGYHARHTEWRWTAGVGTDARGVALAWNLVSGVNDPPTGSERAVWVADSARECPPVQFAADLRQISCEDGSRLDFQPEAERARKDDLLIVKSDYRAPFGSFAGTLPGGIALARGLGVVEHHRASW
jgi:hypothetical protein